MKRTWRSDIYRTPACAIHVFTQRWKRPVLKFYTSEADRTIPWCPCMGTAKFWDLRSWGPLQHLGELSSAPICITWHIDKGQEILSGKRPRLLNASNYPAPYKTFLSLVQTTHSNPLSLFILLCVIGFPIWFKLFSPLFHRIGLYFLALHHIGLCQP